MEVRFERGPLRERKVSVKRGRKREESKKETTEEQRVRR
jgi:hypothetical protein